MVLTGEAGKSHAGQLRLSSLTGLQSPVSSKRDKEAKQEFPRQEMGFQRNRQETLWPQEGMAGLGGVSWERNRTFRKSECLRPSPLKYKCSLCPPLQQPLECDDAHSAVNINRFLHQTVDKQAPKLPGILKMNTKSKWNLCKLLLQQTLHRAQLLNALIKMLCRQRE